jgi:hypothetical protein
MLDDAPGDDGGPPDFFMGDRVTWSDYAWKRNIASKRATNGTVRRVITRDWPIVEVRWDELSTPQKLHTSFLRRLVK